MYLYSIWWYRGNKAQTEIYKKVIGCFQGRSQWSHHYSYAIPAWKTLTWYVPLVAVFNGVRTTLLKLSESDPVTRFSYADPKIKKQTNYTNHLPEAHILKLEIEH